MLLGLGGLYILGIMLENRNEWVHVNDCDKTQDVHEPAFPSFWSFKCILWDAMK